MLLALRRATQHSLSYTGHLLPPSYLTMDPYIRMAFPFYSNGLLEHFYS